MNREYTIEIFSGPPVNGKFFFCFSYDGTNNNLMDWIEINAYLYGGIENVEEKVNRVLSIISSRQYSSSIDGLISIRCEINSPTHKLHLALGVHFYEIFVFHPIYIHRHFWA